MKHLLTLVLALSIFSIWSPRAAATTTRDTSCTGYPGSLDGVSEAEAFYRAAAYLLFTDSIYCVAVGGRWNFAVVLVQSCKDADTGVVQWIKYTGWEYKYLPCNTR